MPYKGQANRTGTNATGHVTVRDTTLSKSATPFSSYGREDFFRDLKKAAKKQGQSSQRDLEKR